MASPTFLNQVPTVASLTDSPRVGTRISVAIVQILISCVFVYAFQTAGGREMIEGIGRISKRKPKPEAMIGSPSARTCAAA